MSACVPCALRRRPGALTITSVGRARHHPYPRDTAYGQSRTIFAPKDNATSRGDTNGTNDPYARRGAIAVMD